MLHCGKMEGGRRNAERWKRERERRERGEREREREREALYLSIHSGGKSVLGQGMFEGRLG